jgi:hypothetical protein
LTEKQVNTKNFLSPILSAQLCSALERSLTIQWGAAEGRQGGREWMRESRSLKTSKKQAFF